MVEREGEGRGGKGREPGKVLGGREKIVEAFRTFLIPLIV